MFFNRLASLFGNTIEDVWFVCDPIVLFSWALLIFLPKWRWTPPLTLLGPLLLSLLYAIIGVSVLQLPEADGIDLFTLEGIVNAFRIPDFVAFGWIHYLALDIVLGRRIVIHAREAKVSYAFHFGVLVPTLILSMMFAPVGFAVYEIIARPLMNYTYEKDAREKRE